MTAIRSDEPRSRLARCLRFSLGTLVGLVIGVVLALVAAIATRDAFSGDVRLGSRGGDISQHGGSSLTLRRNSGSLEQVCNGTCDDLEIENIGRGNTLRVVEVRDLTGRCLACRADVRWVRTGHVQNWRIAGVKQLRITRTDHQAAIQ